MKTDFQIAIKKNKPSILVGIIFLIIIIGIFLFPESQKASSSINLSEYSSIKTVCELATLKNFYHNVAMYEEKPGGGNRFVNNVLFWPFGSYTKVGYKQFWLEYTGVVEMGLDASQIQIVGPSANGIVEIYIPDAKVFNVYADENSLSEPLTESGWFTTISGKEKAEAFAAAQTAMRQEAENDEALLKKAKENAKLLLEQYIINTGKEMGTDLSIRWTENPS